MRICFLTPLFCCCCFDLPARPATLLFKKTFYDYEHEIKLLLNYPAVGLCPFYARMHKLNVPQYYRIYSSNRTPIPRLDLEPLTIFSAQTLCPFFLILTEVIQDYTSSYHHPTKIQQEFRQV